MMGNLLMSLKKRDINRSYEYYYPGAEPGCIENGAHEFMNCRKQTARNTGHASDHDSQASIVSITRQIFAWTNH